MTKVELPLCQRHESICGDRGVAPLIRNLRTDGGKWSGSRPDRFSPPSRYRIGGWVGPIVCLDAPEERKNLPCLESSHVSWVVQRMT
jgi:hypothetical protein